MRHSSSLIETYLARPAYWLTSSRLVQKVIIIGVGVGVEAARTGQRRVWLCLQCACRELEYLWFWIWIRPPKWAFVAHLCVCVSATDFACYGWRPFAGKVCFCFCFWLSSKSLLAVYVGQLGLAHTHSVAFCLLKHWMHLPKNIGHSEHCNSLHLLHLRNCSTRCCLLWLQLLLLVLCCCCCF